MALLLHHGDDDLAEAHEINVTPFIDVMLVLLIIFMVAAPLLTVGVPLSFRQDRRVFIGEEAVRLEVLGERIRQLMLNKTDKQVFLRGDAKVELQELLDVMGQLNAAGIEKVGIVSKLPGER